MFDLLYAGGTALIYQECSFQSKQQRLIRCTSKEEDKGAVRSTQDKFKLFADEVEDAELEIG
jgi:hypothetical protein